VFYKSLYTDNKNDFAGILGLFVDHTEKIKLMEQLQSANKQLEKAQNIAKLGYWEFNYETNSGYWCDELYNIYGRDKSKGSVDVEEYINNVVHPSDKKRVEDAYLESLKTKTSVETKHRITTEDGIEKWVYLIYEIQFDENDNPLKMFGIAQDITENIKRSETLKKQELLLLDQEKHAQMGAMIGNIAHQWRQPLSIISSITGGIIFNYELDIDESKETMIKNMRTIEDKIRYMDSTINTFRNFLKEKKEFKEVILQDRIDIALNIVDITLHDYNIKLINNIDYNNPIKIKIVIGELAETIINIINNAKDILDENNIDEPWVKIDLEKYHDKVIIAIEDNGGGIPEDILSKIFDEYFTTKNEDKGTGLGLHMSYRIIVESLNGNLWAENTQYGAKFFIELPLS
jgi:signal transduction histidine kinase